MVGEGGVEVVKTPQGADDGGNHVKKTDAKGGEEHIEAEGCRPGTAEGAGCVRPNDGSLSIHWLKLMSSIIKQNL